jgi:hypothetical protein
VKGARIPLEVELALSELTRALRDVAHRLAGEISSPATDSLSDGQMLKYSSDSPSKEHAKSSDIGYSKSATKVKKQRKVNQESELSPNYTTQNKY